VKHPRAILVAVALILTACKSNAPAEPQGLKVGATLPLTGAEARIGGFYKEGYDLAFEEVQKAGGLNVGGKKVPVQLVLLDDTSTQATAASLAEKLIHSDGAQFLLGTYSSHLVEAQSVVAEQNGVPYVNGGGGATHIYQRGFQQLFGLLAPVESLAEAQMQWISSEQAAGKLPKPASIALLWENTSHGTDFRRGVQTYVTAHPSDFKLAVDESFELSGRDFSALLSKVKSAATDVFLADAHLPDYITMQRQYVTNGLCHKIQSYGARGSEKQAAEALGKEHVQYVLSAVWWSNQLASTQPAVKRFNELFKAKYNRLPEWYQALGYETARALFVAIEQAGTLDRAKVREKLAALNVESILPGGKLTFPKEKGQQAQNPFVVQQNQPDGTSPIVWPKDVASAAGVAPNPNCK
jgi:branched-chain amino acid transport system substrate-binding protein